MSIPCCIALTMLHGVPGLAAMTTYAAAEGNALTDRIGLVTDAPVPVLSYVIKVEAADGATLVQDQRMTVADFSYVGRSHRCWCGASAAKLACR